MVAALWSRIRTTKREAMAETALTEWEGRWASVSVKGSCGVVILARLQRSVTRA
jgi:hypothetical protein